MNKKSTLIAAALMAVSSLTVSAEENGPVTTGEAKPAEWVVGNYYYLKTVANKYLSLSAEKLDSVVVIEKGKVGTTKTDLDLALWEISEGETSATGVSYQFRNKKTKALLAFDKDLKADPILSTEGIAQWSFSKQTIDGKAGYVIKSQLNSNDAMRPPCARSRSRPLR